MREMSGPVAFSSRWMVSLLVLLLVLLFLPVSSLAIIDATLQMQLGNPTGATVNPTNTSNYLVSRTVEALDFANILGQPRWASWDLTSGDIGSAPRCTSFYVDSTLPTNFYRVKTTDYNNSGYDRGHMCTSEDRTDTTNNNKLVFYMSNIAPQTPDNNQGPWASFENYCQALAVAGYEMLITCGPVSFDGSTLLNSNKVAIPGSTWKIAVVVPAGSGSALSRITADTRVISVKMPNVAGIRSTPWTNYITSAQQIQTDTAYTFFTALSASIAEVFLAKVDGTPAPSIAGFTPANGPVGTSVSLSGANFTGASKVKFNGLNTTFNVVSSTQITATVPSGATTGPISVLTPGGLVTSASSFTVVPAPSISGFSPTNGPVGTLVAITGANLTGASSVTFNGTSASFTVVSSSQITATVPAGATTGPIAATTPGGTATSAASFGVGSGKVVISQVYGGGGNAGAPYKNDFIEVYNSGSATVDLSTYSVQYAAATSATWSQTTLSGTLAPGQYYLIQEYSGGTNGVALPTPRSTGTINLAATAGKVALTKTQTLLTVSNPIGNADVVDFVGYGTTANAYEGTGPAPAPSNTTSDLRAAGGATDTDNNNADFTAGTVNPRN